MWKCSRLFLSALAMAIGLSTTACPEPEPEPEPEPSRAVSITVAQEDMETPASNADKMTIVVRDIPDRYDRGGISLWSDRGRGFDSHTGMVTGNSLTFTLAAGPGLYDAILSLWSAKADGHWRIWSMGLGPGTNIVPFGEFVEFTD